MTGNGKIPVEEKRQDPLILGRNRSMKMIINWICDGCGIIYQTKEYIKGTDVPGTFYTRYWCKGETEVRADSDVTGKRQFCQKCRKLNLEEIIKESIYYQVGARYIDASLDDFPNSKKKESFLLELQRRGENLYITGDLGCGKTHFAAAMVRLFTTYNPRGEVQYVNGYELPEEEYDNQLHKCKVLILDELVVYDERHGRRLFALIDNRYRGKLTTIGISNYTGKQIIDGESGFGQDLGPKIISRLTRDSDKNILTLKPRQ